MKIKVKVLLIISLILLVVVYVLLLIRTRMKKDLYDEEEFPKESLEVNYNVVERVKNKTDYFTVIECIEKFYTKYLTDEEIYSLIDENYLKNNGLNVSDIASKYKKDNKVLIDITDMYVSQIGRGVKAYFCYGYCIDRKTDEKEEIKMIVKIDNKIRTFSILPYGYLKEKGYLNVNETTKLDFSEETEIKDKTSNKYTFRYINDEDYVKKIFTNYINRCLFNPEEAYECLDNEYKTKRFGEFNSFRKYLKNKEEIFKSLDSLNAKKPGDFETDEEYEKYLADYIKLDIVSYEKSITDEYVQYAIIDNFGNTYIFRESTTMNYSVLLDTYTLQIPEFVLKYDNANEKEKAALNTKKFIDSINEKDYKFAYSCLAEIFRNNNYSTLESFENYVKSNFYDMNNFEFTEFRNEGETYIFSIKITDAKNKDNEPKVLQIIMELRENRTFVMSFNIK